MGRYFNDDMTEDQNDDYDSYLEHYGIPKEKWDATTAEKAAKLNDDYHKLPKSYRNKKSLELSNELANKETKELNKVRRKIRR